MTNLAEILRRIEEDERRTFGRTLTTAERSDLAKALRAKREEKA